MRKRRWLLPAIAVLGLTTGALAFSGFDFGLFRDDQLEAHSSQLFGFVEGIEHSSTESVSKATAEADPTSLITVAKGLQVRVVSAAANLAANVDQMALWPNDLNPTHLIACNEQGTAQPGVQRIRISDGAVETILTGTSSCDPVRRTPWGTIIVAEEVGPGGGQPGRLDAGNHQPAADDERHVRSRDRHPLRRERRQHRDPPCGRPSVVRGHRALSERCHVLR